MSGSCDSGNTYSIVRYCEAYSISYYGNKTRWIYVDSFYISNWLHFFLTFLIEPIKYSISPPLGFIYLTSYGLVAWPVTLWSSLGIVL